MGLGNCAEESEFGNSANGAALTGAGPMERV